MQDDYLEENEISDIEDFDDTDDIDADTFEDDYVPDSPDAYVFTKPENIEDENYDFELEKSFRDWCFDEDIPQSKANKLYKKYCQWVLSQNQPKAALSDEFYEKVE